MTPDEKAVIDAFQGREAYERVLADRAYFFDYSAIDSVVELVGRLPVRE